MWQTRHPMLNIKKRNTRKLIISIDLWIIKQFCHRHKKAIYIYRSYHQILIWWRDFCQIKKATKVWHQKAFRQLVSKQWVNQEVYSNLVWENEREIKETFCWFKEHKIDSCYFLFGCFRVFFFQWQFKHTNTK